MKKIFLILLFLLFTNIELISAEKKQRIISLAPSTTEILFSLGLNEEIIAVTIYCNYPLEAKTKEKIGSFSQPDIEKILFLKPDIIFATGLEQALVVEELKRLGLKVYVSDPSSIEELFESIKEIGKLTDRENEADILVNQMRVRIEEITKKINEIPKEKRPKVFIEIWHDPLITAGKGSFIDELVRLAGGVNIAYDVPRPYCYFSLEQLIKQNPDCIILCHTEKKETINTLKKRLGWDRIKAVENNRVIGDINPDLFLRPGPRLVEGLEEIHKRLYPNNETK